MNAPPDLIALIGAGRMGRGVGRNLLRRGHALRVCDVEASARAAMAELGAQTAQTPAAAAAGAAVVITCLPDLAAVETTYFGPDGLLHNAQPGTLLIEMTSSSPELTRRIGVQARQHGLGLVDAPMLRGAQEAWEGTIHVLLGGEPQWRARGRALLEDVAERVIEVGELGSAHTLKVLNNAVSMANAAVIGEVFHTAHRLGISSESLLTVLGSGLGGSRMLELYGPRLLSGEHPRSGSIATGAKDLGLFVGLARDSGASAAVIEAAQRLYQAMHERDAGGEAPSRLADLLDGAGPAAAP